MEFCSHVARHFTITTGDNRIERARLSLAHMGSSVSTLFILFHYAGLVALFL